jgi:hypothetical protein
MAVPYQHKRSTTASAVPTTSDLIPGELAVNVYDGKLFLEKNSGSPTVVSFRNDDQNDARFVQPASPTGPITVQGVRIDVVAKGSVGSGTVTFDASASAAQTITVTGTQTWAFSSWGSEYGEVEILATNAGAAAITLPTINWLKGDGTKSTTFSSMGVTLQASGTNTFLVWTYDGGTTLYGRAG